MAEDDPSYKSARSKDDDKDSDDDSSSRLQLDLGDDSPHSTRDLNRLGNQNVPLPASSSNNNETHKREDNPFSFKHFLRSDSANSNYQAKGARPKTYEHRSSSLNYGNNPPESKPARVLPEYSSALPDFVQDHLVIEQCYLGGNTNTEHYSLDVNNLPDFTPSRETRNNGVTIDSSHSRDPLDLPMRSQDSFPLDLPVGGPSSSRSRNGSVSEVGNSKSLPDFLTDSAVCSQINETLSVPHSPEGELERLRSELDLAKRHLADKTRLCDSLNRELDATRNREREYNQNLARALEKVEDNLEKSNKRAAAAENMVIKLKHEVKSLTAELNILKIQNPPGPGEEAAGGQGYSNLNFYRLAQELRSAAGSAEHSLRQLLTGVDNLRIMAASLENVHRLEETSDHFSNFDEGAGPAL
ncbi:unnamed protein product [Phyllotreta striolata]|uniref:Endosome-associated-trafficking regulator 1 n=1 Tax=Phyllotreta striolata TaxID=444603 RepID=A0A9N9TH52_PHYSR|nr:unnamed protein product [Phyllotreta striolata]